MTLFHRFLSLKKLMNLNEIFYFYKKSLSLDK